MGTTPTMTQTTGREASKEDNTEGDEDSSAEARSTPPMLLSTTTTSSTIATTTTTATSFPAASGLDFDDIAAMPLPTHRRESEAKEEDYSLARVLRRLSLDDEEDDVTAAAAAADVDVTVPATTSPKVALITCGANVDHRDPVAACAERPSRVQRVLERLAAAHLPTPLVLLPTPHLATDEELLRVHTKSYLKKLQRMVATAPPHGDESSRNSRAHDRLVNDMAKDEFDSVFMCVKSLEAARAAAGASIEAVDAVMSSSSSSSSSSSPSSPSCETQSLDAVACAIRPPGHHAEPHCAMGFCLLNNAALAARRAVDVHNARRVMVVDFDVHHGNGTQRVFWADERVFYVSVHRWDHAKFYPHGELDGAPEAVGPERTPAAGTTCNVAFSDEVMGDPDYAFAWERIVEPLVRQFDPELLVFSAGFDAARGDPIGGYDVTPACFGAMVARLVVASPLNGNKRRKSVLLLEGGYDVDTLGEAFESCVRGLFASSPDDTAWPATATARAPHLAAVQAVARTTEAMRKFWVLPGAL